MNVLVVDDNPLNVELLAVLLLANGYEVQRATTLAEARTWLGQDAPSLVLLDLRLGTEDGLVLAREMKADGALRLIPIIAVTAAAMKGDEERALAAGCDGYITKPIDTRTFIAKMRSFLRPGGTSSG